jgi:hypothetical protein
MLSEDEYFRDLTEAKLWERYCGFLDLSIDEFMDIQEELLMDQIERVSGSLLGKKVMNNTVPKSIEEFRQTVPLTTYDDYEPYLSERQEDVLTEKPALWCHSAGRGGSFKWIPHSQEFVKKVVRDLLGSFILASTSRRGQVNISPGLRLLCVLPPRPYASGWLVYSLVRHFSCQVIPPVEEAENEDFEERIRMAVWIALKNGADTAAAIGSVLVKMGEAFSGETQSMGFSPYLLHPKIIFRLLQAWLRSKRARRPLLPKDLWPVKSIVTSGVDTAIYKKDISHYWGNEPYEFYASSEAGFIAMQAWNKKAMTFLADSVFLEFIPEEEQSKCEADKDYQPSTMLLNEVEEGKSYEVIITQFYGMPLTRYRLRDLVKVVTLRDDETGVNLPQIVFQRRVGETINLASMANLDEKTIWQAIANTNIKYTDWTACKEYDRNQSFLRLYLELNEDKEAAEVAAMIDKQLRLVDLDYRDIDSYLGLQPVKVTLLPPGTFERYKDEKSEEGSDLAHLKPAHINPPQADIQRLLKLSEVGKER